MNFGSVDLVGKGDTEQPSCMGHLCDRKEPLKTTKSCGCFTSETHISPVVLEYKVIIKDVTVEIEVVNKERSYRTS